MQRKKQIKLAQTFFWLLVLENEAAVSLYAKNYFIILIVSLDRCFIIHIYRYWKYACNLTWFFRSDVPNKTFLKSSWLQKLSFSTICKEGKVICVPYWFIPRMDGTSSSTLPPPPKHSTRFQKNVCKNLFLK